MIGNIHGIGARNEQQDAFGISSISDKRLVMEKGVLVVIADGMGGMENSGIISHDLVPYAISQFSELQGSQREILLRLSNKVNAMASTEFPKEMGSTMIAASIHNKKLDFFSIGDSRIALLRGGKLLTLNRLHNYGAELDSSAARGHTGVTTVLENTKRDRLTSYLGMRDLKAVDLPDSPIELSNGDKIILMTDGVFNTLSDDQIIQALRLPAQEASVRLEAMIQDMGNARQDNYTAVIYEVDEPVKASNHPDKETQIRKRITKKGFSFGSHPGFIIALGMVAALLLALAIILLINKPWRGKNTPKPEAAEQQETMEMPSDAATANPLDSSEPQEGAQEATNQAENDYETDAKAPSFENTTQESLPNSFPEDAPETQIN